MVPPFEKSCRNHEVFILCRSVQYCRMKINLICVTLQYLSLLLTTYCKDETTYCPAEWMELAHDQCFCNFYRAAKCKLLYGPPFYVEDVSLQINPSFCVNYDNDTQQLISGFCPYSHYQIEYSKNMTSSVTKGQVNEVMCGQLKRKGRLCSRCISGYGIAVFSKTTDECVRCDNKYAWPLYLALVLLPITLFYFLVIIFNFSATQPPVTAYTFYCQLFVQVIYNIDAIRHHFEAEANKTLINLTWTVSEIWNLDMFWFVVPGFCLDERLINIDAILLELVAALYPLPLIFLTFILIEMHASNIRVVVYLWKPFHRCFTSVRRTWDPRSSVTNAFATFLLLSSFKVCFTTMNIISKTNKLYLQNGTKLDPVLYNDPAIPYRNVHRQTYFVPLLLLNILLVILPIFLLCLYPTKLWRRLAQKVLPTRMKNAINLFMECFQGHYKNGTTGTYDYRFVSCFGFALRLIAGLFMAHKFSRGQGENGPMNSLVVILIATSMFYAHVRPCKKQYMNVTESLLYCTAGLLLLPMVRHHRSPNPYHSNLILAAILAPSVVFMGSVLYRVSNVFGITHRAKRAVLKIKGALLKRKAGEVDEPEPHRLTHPTQYTPLIK